MPFGLISTGFVKKKLTDIKASIEDSLRAVFGPVNTSPQSAFGQIVGVMSEAIAEVWDVAEDVYYSQYPVSAEGVPLDNAVDLTGITRLAASSSFVTALLGGDEGTVVPVGTQIRKVDSEELFENDIPVTITKSSVLRITITLDTIADATVYSVTIAGVLNSIISGAGATALSILTALQAEININMAGYTQALNTDDEELQVQVTDGKTIFTASSSANINIKPWTPATVFSVNKGEIIVPIGSMTIIETPVSGLDLTDNILDGTLGRAVETDDELRLRRKQSLRVSGAATVPSIEARIFAEVEGVTSATVKENRSDVTDSEGRTPHSFELIVEGGTPQDIADKLWEIKPAGIQTVGTETQGVIDSQGNTQLMHFSRPIPKYVHLDVQISLYSEETFPVDGIIAIKDALAAFGNALEPGDDLIIQRFYASIYSVEGVKNVESFKFGITATDVPVALIASGTTDSGSTADKEISDGGAQFVTDGAVAGMICKNTSSSAYSAIDTVTEVLATLYEDIFTTGTPGIGYEIGVLGPVNVPMKSNHLPIFTVANINVTIV